LSSIKVGYNVPGPFSVQRSISSIYNLVYPDGDPLGGGLTVWVKANYQNQDTFDTIREVETSEITNSNLDMIGLTTQNIPTWDVDIRYEAGMKVSTLYAVRYEKPGDTTDTYLVRYAAAGETVNWADDINQIRSQYGNDAITE